MKHTNKLLYSYLRSLPRHGQGGKSHKKKNTGAKTGTKPGATAAVEEYKKLITAMSGYETANSKILVGVQKTIGQAEQLANVYKTNVEMLGKMEERNTKLQKAFNLTYKEAGTLGKQLDIYSATLKTGRQETEKYFLAVKKLQGGFLKSTTSVSEFDKKLIRGQKILQRNIRLTGEQASKNQLFYSSLQKLNDEGEVIPTLEKQMMLQYELNEIISEKTGFENASNLIGQEIAKTGLATLNTFSRYPNQIGLAVLKMKSLGMSMDALHKTAKGFLNIEESVGNEIDYQLISGQRLVDQNGENLISQMNQYTMQGKSAEAADVYHKMLKSQVHVLDGSVFNMESFAKLTNQSANDVAEQVARFKMLEKSGLGNLFGKSAKELKSELSKTHGKKKTALEEYIKEIETSEKDKMTMSEVYLQNIDKTLTAGIVSSAAYGGDDEGFTKRLEDARATMEGYTANFHTQVTDAKGFFGQSLQAANVMTDLGNVQLNLVKSLLDNQKAPLYKALTDFVEGFGGTSTLATAVMTDLKDFFTSKFPASIVKGIQGASIPNMTIPVAEGGNVNVKNVIERAKGGIASGPTTGYPATLHGIEAVVPLPDGKSIPVTVQGAPIDYALLAAAMSQIKVTVDTPFQMQSGRA